MKKIKALMLAAPGVWIAAPGVWIAARGVWIAAVIFFALAGITYAQANDGYRLTFSAFTADRVSVTQYEGEQFNVNYNLRNPGTETFNGSLSAILADNTGNIIAVIGTRTSTSFAAGSGRSSYVTCSVPITVRPGRYQLRIAVRPAGGEQRVVTISQADVPYSIDFEVTENPNIVVAPLIQKE